MKYLIVGEDFYGNSVTITDEDEMIPIGVIAIANVNPDIGWWLTSGSDFYVRVGDQYYGVDYPGLLLYLAQYKEQHVLLGKLVPNEVFLNALSYLKKELPRKTAYKAREGKPILFSEVDLLETD